MQTCSICHTQSPDSAIQCSQCKAELSQYSETTQALLRIEKNDRIKSVRVSVSDDCCPACRAVEGAYAKPDAPKLPVEGCSSQNGCRCFYLPELDVLFP